MSKWDFGGSLSVISEWVDRILLKCLVKARGLNLHDSLDTLPQEFMLILCFVIDFKAGIVEYLDIPQWGAFSMHNETKQVNVKGKVNFLI